MAAQKKTIESIYDFDQTTQSGIERLVSRKSRKLARLEVIDTPSMQGNSALLRTGTKVEMGIQSPDNTVATVDAHIPLSGQGNELTFTRELTEGEQLVVRSFWASELYTLGLSKNPGKCRVLFWEDSGKLAFTIEFFDGKNKHGRPKKKWLHGTLSLRAAYELGRAFALGVGYQHNNSDVTSTADAIDFLDFADEDEDKTKTKTKKAA